MVSRTNSTREDAPAAKARQALLPSPPVATRRAGFWWMGLIGLALAWAIFPLLPGTWGWGFATARYLPPELVSCLALLAGLALIPSTARGMVPACAWIGARSWLWVPAAVALAGMLPDRLHFLGDALTRRGATDDPAMTRLLPQALPVDLWLHVDLPRFLSARLAIAPEAFGRGLGMAEAALLAWIATRFARALGARGSTAFAMVAILVFGGALALDTGHSGAASEMCVLVAAVAWLAVRSARGGSSLVPLALTVALGLFVHPVAAPLIPVFVVATAWWVRQHAGRNRRRLAWAALACAILVAALILVGPRLAGLLVSFDLPRHVGPAIGSALWLAATPLGALDRLNAIAVLAPLALPLLVPALLLPRRACRTPEAMVLIALALPFATLLLVVHPQQGVLRDLDVFGPGAVALSSLAAWVTCGILESEREVTWLGVSSGVVALVSTTAWLALQHDAGRGLTWVEGFVSGPPARAASERALTWDYLGYRAMEENRWSDAARAWSLAAELAPSPRILTLLGMATTMTGSLEQAQSLFRRSLALDPGQRLAWRGLATTSLRIGDAEQARRAVLEIERMRIASPELPEMVEALARLDAASAGTARAHTPRRRAPVAPHGAAEPPLAAKPPHSQPN